MVLFDMEIVYILSLSDGGLLEAAVAQKVHKDRSTISKVLTHYFKLWNNFTGLTLSSWRPRTMSKCDNKMLTQATLGNRRTFLSDIVTDPRRVWARGRTVTIEYEGDFRC